MKNQVNNKGLPPSSPPGVRPGSTSEVNFTSAELIQSSTKLKSNDLLKAAEELKRQKDRFSSLFESAPLGYIMLDSHGTITDINNKATKLFAHPKTLMVGKSLGTYLAPSSLNGFFNFLKQVSACEEEQSGKLDFLIRDNSEFYGIMYAVPYCVPGHEPEIYLTITDLSELHKAVDALKPAKLRLDLALEASSTGICEVDPVGGQFIFDQYSCQLLDLPDTTFKGPLSSFIQRIHPYDRLRFEESFRESVITGEPISFEFRTAEKHTDLRYIQVQGRLVPENDDRRIFLATFTDISEKKRWELENQRLAAEQDRALLQAALTASENEKKRMSETLHDGVAQMLWAVKIKLHSMRSQAPQLPFEQVNTLVEQAITDIRNLSFELTPVILQDFGLKAALEEMATRLKDKQLDFRIKVNVRDDLPSSALLNIYRITQELVNNAIKHSGCSKIEIKIGIKGNCVILHVIDNGAGIDQKVLKKSGGTGLCSIRNRLKLYDGKLDIQKNPPSGTLVTVTLRNIDYSDGAPTSQAT